MSDVIDELKKVKVPLWAQWLGRWRAYRRRRVARKELTYVATITHYAALKTLEGHIQRVDSYYILTERGDGVRSFEYKRGAAYWVKEDATWVYVHIIEPWRLGKCTNKAVVDWASKQTAPTFEG